MRTSKRAATYLYIAQYSLSHSSRNNADADKLVSSEKVLLKMKVCMICDIVGARIPSWVIYQEGEIICFLPKTLAAYGHTLIAPKDHYQDLYATPENVLPAILVVAKKLAMHFNHRIGSSGLNLLHASGISAQQSVPHLHFHLIPRFNGDGLDAWPKLPSLDYDKDEMLKKLRL